jgi:hypothetical protein
VAVEDKAELDELAISSTSLHQRSFDAARRISPVCARPVRRRIARGSFQPLRSITRCARGEVATSQRAAHGYGCPKTRVGMG